MRHYMNTKKVLYQTNFVNPFEDIQAYFSNRIYTYLIASFLVQITADMLKYKAVMMLSPNKRERVTTEEKT